MDRHRERIDGLDALRGFALLGILLINIQVFAGYGFLPSEAKLALSGSGFDAELKSLLDITARGRFYSLFSLLFGYSFVMLAHRPGSGGEHEHLRRMAGLLVIGLAHSILLWPWDILLLYALVGLLLTPFLRLPPRTLLLSGIGLLLAVGVLRGAWLYLELGVRQRELAALLLEKQLPHLAGGSPAAIIEANLRLTPGVFIERLEALRPLRVLAMFLLGAAAARLHLAERAAGHVGLLRGLAVLGLGAGLALGVAQVALAPIAPLRQVVFLTAETLSAPLVAVGYAAAFTLWWRGDGPWSGRTRAFLAPAGRMALTNYLLQSAVCVPLFYGFGGGWFAEVSLAHLSLFALGLFTLQVSASHLWLARFRQGPCEWLWRWQYKGSRPPLRHAADTTPPAGLTAVRRR